VLVTGATDYAYGFNLGWVLTAPVLLWNFNPVSATTNNAAGAVLYADTAAFESHGTIQATLTGVTNGTYLQKTSLVTDVPANLDVIALQVILDNEPEWQHVTAIDFRPGVGATYYTGGSKSTSIHVTTGEQWVGIAIADIATFKDLGSSVINGRLTFTSSGGTAAPYSSQPKAVVAVAKAGGIPTAILTFDDGRVSIHDWIMDQLETRGLPGHFNLAWKNIGTSPFFANISAVVDLQDRAWSIGVNATADDNPITTYGNMANVVTDIQATWAYMAANGLDGPGKFHGCWPNGTIRNAGVPVQKTTITANGTTTITMADTSSITAGMAVVGYRVPRGTTVASVTNSTTVVLSAVVPAATIPTMSFTDTSNAFYDGKSFAALKAAGMLTMRGTNPGEKHTRFGIGDAGMLLVANSMSSTGGDGTAAAMNARIATAQKNKSTTISYAHNAVDTVVSGLDTLKTELSAHYDFLATEVQAQRLQVLNMAQWWARDGGNSCP